MRENERRGNRGGDRRGGRFGDRRRNGPRDEGFRKGSQDFNNRRGGDREGDDRRTKQISRNAQQRGRGPRDHQRSDDKKPKDLDGDLMNYWIKSGKQDPGTFLITFRRKERGPAEAERRFGQLLEEQGS